MTHLCELRKAKMVFYLPYLACCNTLEDHSKGICTQTGLWGCMCLHADGHVCVHTHIQEAQSWCWESPLSLLIHQGRPLCRA